MIINSASAPPPTASAPAVRAPHRALADALGLIAVALGPSLWLSVVQFAALFGPAPAPLTRDAGTVLVAVSITAGALWLALLVRVRHCPGSFRPRLTAGAAAVLALWALADRGILPGLGGDYRIAEALLCLWLVSEVLHRHGITPASLPKASTTGRRWRWAAPVVVGVAALVLVLLGSGISGLWHAYGPGPVTSQDQISLLRITSTPQFISRAVWAGVVEELALTAAPVLLLRAAGAPRWQWVALPVGLRIVIHLYLGTPAIVYGLVGVAMVVLVVRYGRALPLAAGHALADWPMTQLPSSVGPLVAAGVVLAAQVGLFRLEKSLRPDPTEPGFLARWWTNGGSR
ncbi:CPBP family glutamic-type intramembrane protease [Streptomyces sp. NBRC 110465]|uniref:CPBP family glutamic-type intramembrane protease n=1 Tax=Streptomyces sp. NBRC 110465 TaxID=1897621 RepID=UPI000932E0ED|nr:hypothetical protein [Streptomyces sp. NBRC 110465]